MATSFSSASLASQASLLDTSQDRMLQNLNAQKKGQIDDARIDKGAKEFEAMLLGSWLQQAQQSMATVPGADEDEDNGTKEQMMSIGVQSVARSIVASGGIGIASMISKAMHHVAEKASLEAESTAETPESGKIQGQH